MHPCDDSFRHVWIKLITLWCYFLIPSWLPRGSCEVLLSLIRRFFGQFVGFVQILSWILSVQGGLNQTCRDEIFDIEIIQIPLADVERLRSNRFYGFWRFGFRDGVVVDWWLWQKRSSALVCYYIGKIVCFRIENETKSTIRGETTKNYRMWKEM